MILQADPTALVLGGGGVAGIAWQIGLLAGLSRAGRPVHEARTLIGTSAGASVAALLTGGASLDLLADDQSSEEHGETWRRFSLVAVGLANRDLLAKVGGDVATARRRIGAYALRSPTPDRASRLAAIERRIGYAAWSGRDLRIVATDALTGERVVFTSADGVPLAVAVAASSAVPGTWPPVPIDGRDCMDGGIWSLTNADLAVGSARIVVVAPFGWGDDNPVSGHLRAEVTLLERTGVAITVIMPDEAARAAMSDNLLDPARRPAALKAGLAQAVRLVAQAGPPSSAPRHDAVFSVTEPSS